jgi:choline-sulfatase
MLGERGMWYKMSFFEGSARVPMLFHAPGRFQPSRVNQPVSLVDLLPTLVDLADNEHAPHTYTTPIDGRSLLPLLHNNQAEADRTAYGECWAKGPLPRC